MKYTVIAMSILFSIVCYAQNIPTDTSAPVVAYWKKGEKKHFTITKTVQKVDKTNVVSEAKSVYGATILVKDSTAEGYTLEWTYQYKLDRAASGQISQYGLTGLDELMNNLKFVYTTDDVGSFNELVNYEEVKVFIDKTLETINTRMKDQKEKDMVMDQMRKIFGTKENVQNLLLKDINLYHTLYGAEYSLTKIESETLLPNALGGDPFPATLNVRLVKKPAGNIALVYMDMLIDKVKAREMLIQLAQKLSSSMGKAIEEKDLPNLFEISDHYEYEILLNSGWIKRAYVKRIAKVGDSKKTETLQLELQ